MTDQKNRAGVLTAHQAPNAWRIVCVLTLANLLNFYDRAVPAIVIEPIKDEFGLSDLAIGVLSGAFTVVYAVAGIAVGRMADRGSRRTIMAVGLLVWSIFTAAGGGAWSFASLLIFRLAVGVGEASYAPAANSLLADLFPAAKRSRAIAVFQFGQPLGLTLAFFTTGAIADAFGSWRAPFVIAAVPGFLVAVAMMFIKEPERGASEERPTTISPVHQPIRVVLRIPTMWWLILSGIGLQIAAYAVATFLVPLFQRYFELSLVRAATNAGIVLGLSGILGLLFAGIVAERAARRSRRLRLTYASVSLAASVPLTFWALTLPHTATSAFVLIFSVAWFLQFAFYVAAYPAVADVIEPRLRATGIAVLFAAFYLLGGALGPVVVGALSDQFGDDTIGLRFALLAVVPSALAVAAAGLFGASATVEHDHALSMKTPKTALVPATRQP
ncbi:MFS transporter [Nocardia sp. NPDC050435]|uniref:spinster family MFS transporter n=1 Tax=Nocardia sp. NPDC050435 TaxID=3155040 RepID=UPI00340E1737